jgi:hypothetical protein
MQRGMNEQAKRSAALCNGVCSTAPRVLIQTTCRSNTLGLNCSYVWLMSTSCKTLQANQKREKSLAVRDDFRNWFVAQTA